MSHKTGAQTHHVDIGRYMNGEVYKAKWGWPLTLTSWFGAGVLMVLPFMISRTTHEKTVAAVVFCLMGAILLISGLFAVRSYSVKADELCIQRLVWVTRFPLHGLQKVSAGPYAMRGSLRLFGNSGLFAITGWYRNETLGTYRAFVTDPKRAVVLQFTGRTVVVSPENPDTFVTEISRFITGNSGGILRG